MKARSLAPLLSLSVLMPLSWLWSQADLCVNVDTKTSQTNESVSGQASVIASYGNIPLSFEQNFGQVDEKVKFLTRGSGYSLFLTPDEAVIAFQNLKQDSEPHRADILRMKFAGANPSPTIIGEGMLEGKTSYLIGSEKRNWKTGIPSFEHVRYSNIYDGIDAVYYGKGKQLEYDLVISPNVSPGKVKLTCNGSDGVTIADNGDLIFKFAENELRQHKPLAYQEVNGERVEIAVNYNIEPVSSTVGFIVGDYDHSQPLLIDPILSYSTYLGGGADTFGTSIAVDASGNAYVTGYTDALDFPLAGAFQQANNGGTAGFVTKLNPSGTGFVYSTYLGGNSRTFPSSIKVDAAGSAYVGGWTLSSNFPTTVGAYRTTTPSGGGRPSFVTKLSPNGSSLSYSTYLGAVNDLTGLALDSTGNAYLTGYTQDAVFPTTPGAYKTTLGEGIVQNAFVTKLNATGSALVYSTFVGASVPFGGVVPVDQATAIAVDSSGNAYITGLSVSNNYPTTSGAFQIFPGGSRDVFVTKLNASGSALVYSTYLGGHGQDRGFGIAVDSTGNAYVTGSFENDDFPFTSGGFLPTTATNSGSFGLAFLTKLNPTGTALIYSTALGYRTTMAASGVAVGSDGSAYVIGGEGGGMGGYAVNAIQSTSHSNDAWLLKMNPAGTGLAYATPLGGNGIGNSSTSGSAIAIDASGNAYITGRTEESDFPITSGAAQVAKPGGGANSAFIAKIGLQPGDCPAIAISPQPLPFALFAQSYIQQVTATGGVAPYTFSLAANFGTNVLPSGLTIALDGTVSGTPTSQAFGKYLVTVQAIDSHGCTGIRTLQLDLASRAPRNVGIHLKVVARPVIRIGNEYTSFITYTNSTTTDLVNVPILIRVPDYVSLRLRYAQPARPFNQLGFNYISLILPRIKATGDGSIQTVPVVIKVADPNRFNQKFRLEAADPRYNRGIPTAGSATTLRSRLRDDIFLSLIKNDNKTSPTADCNIFDPDADCGPPPPGSQVPCDLEDGPCAEYFDPFDDDHDPCLLPPCFPLLPPLDVDYDRARINPGAPSDPNDKSGPAGSGAEGYYTGDIALPYVVSFENVATATLPAQDVVVTDQLDPNVFDFSTFSFNLIAFGDKQVASPVGVKQFTSDIDLRPARQSIVRVSGNFESTTGLIKWQFHTLDPVTGQPPEDPQAGFLPPNRTSPEGQGTLFYTVKAKSGLATGTQLKNKARIVFDVNAPIDTPEWLNTIDNTKPTSSVQALPSFEPLSFTVNWSGTDVGSGIRTYTIYVSQDGGPFTPFLTSTTQKSIVVNTIQTNHTFRFYSIATDAAGNVEPDKSSADTTTTVVAPVSVSGRVTAPDGRGLRNVVVSITDPSGAQQTATTSSFGFYSLPNVAPGQQYVVRVSSRLYRFPSQTLQVTDTLTNVDFVGLE